MKNIPIQSRKILFKLFNLFGEVSKCSLTVVFGKFKMKKKEREKERKN